MRRYFYGYNVHILFTADGIPVEYTFLPGKCHDSNALKQMPLLVAAGSRIYADSAYTNYTIEDMLKDAENIELLVQRKSNSKRKHEPYVDYKILTMRKRIKTTCCNGIRIYFESCNFYFQLCYYKNNIINSNLS